MNTIIIGIAGGTGSGKTTLTEKLREHFGSNEVSVINHDSYYKRHDELPYEERCKLNYDHPDSFDTALMIAHLQELRAESTGKEADGSSVPVSYDGKKVRVFDFGGTYDLGPVKLAASYGAPDAGRVTMQEPGKARFRPPMFFKNPSNILKALARNVLKN